MILFLFIAVFIFPCQAAAYIDPGTGGMVTGFLSTALIVIASLASLVFGFLWRNRSIRYASIVTLLVIVGIFAAVMMKPKRPGINSGARTAGQTFKKILLLGIDGFDPEVARYLMDNGHLVNFKKLAAQGTFAPLSTATPPISPVVWTVIATGVNPGKTNLFDFMRFDRNKLLPFLSILEESFSLSGLSYESPVQGFPFWRLLSNQKVSARVIHWPVTFPAEQIEGEMLAGMGVPDVRGLLNGYQRFTDVKVETPSVGATRVVPVQRSGNVVEADLTGPQKTIGQEAAREPFVVTLAGGDEATLTIQNESYPIKRGVWSDWIKVKFKQGFGRSTQAVFKAYPEQLSPQFDLLTTSVQFDPAHPAVPISYPDSFSKDLADEIGTFYTLGMPEDTKAVNDLNLSIDAFVRQVGEIREEREKMFWVEFKKLIAQESGVLAIVFDEFDRFNHFFFSQEVNSADGKVTGVGQIMTRLYEDKDRLMGKILENLPTDTALLVVSDHGFGKLSRMVNLNTWLLENHYLSLVNDIAPENARPLYRDVDWSRTKAYSYGYTSINLNIKGRENKGIVDPTEKDALLREIIEKLKATNDEGKKVVSRVDRSTEIYSGDYVKNAPDLVVGFLPSYRTDWESPIGAFTSASVLPNTRPWQSDHIFDPSFVPGSFFSNLKIMKDHPAVYDITPTILDILGVRSPVAMDGKSLLR